MAELHLATLLHAKFLLDRMQGFAFGGGFQGFLYGVRVERLGVKV